MNKYIFYIAVILIISSILTFFIIYHKKNEHFQDYCSGDSNAHKPPFKCYGWHNSADDPFELNNKDYANPSFCQNPEDLGTKWQRIIIGQDGNIADNVLTVGNIEYTLISLPAFEDIIGNRKMQQHFFSRSTRGGSFEKSVIGNTEGEILDDELANVNITYNNYILLSDNVTAYIPIPIDSTMFCLIRQLICYILDDRCTIDALETAAVEAERIKEGVRLAAVALETEIGQALADLKNKEGDAVTAENVTELRGEYENLLIDYGLIKELKIGLENRINGDGDAGSSSGYRFEIGELQKTIEALEEDILGLQAMATGAGSEADALATLTDALRGKSTTETDTDPDPDPDPDPDTETSQCNEGDSPPLLCDDDAIAKIKAIYAKENASTYEATLPDWEHTRAWDPVNEKGKNIDLIMERDVGYKIIDDRTDDRFQEGAGRTSSHGIWNSRATEPVVITKEGTNKCIIEYPWLMGYDHKVDGVVDGGQNYQGIGKRKYTFALLKDPSNTGCTWEPTVYEPVIFAVSNCHNYVASAGGECNDDNYPHIHYDCSDDNVDDAVSDIPECREEAIWRDTNEGEWVEGEDSSIFSGGTESISDPICQLANDGESGTILQFRMSGGEDGNGGMVQVECTEEQIQDAKTCHRSQEKSSEFQKYSLNGNIWELNNYTDSGCTTQRTI